MDRRLNQPTPRAPWQLLKGQAGVWRVASELALRGYNPLFPGVDHGYDLMTAEGVRIQVKSANLNHGRGQVKKAYPNGAYWFHLRKSAYARGNKTLVPMQPQVFSLKNDFVILWGIDENRFFVVPASYLDSVSLVVVGPAIYHRDLDVVEITELSEAGFSQKEIAEYLGVAQMTVSRRLNGKFITSKTPMCRQVRECENRWDFINDFIQQRVEADAVSSALQSLEQQET